MFDAVLIANRGEIARRVIRTLDRLGIGSVAIYTPSDAGAPFVREASQAIQIDSYLDIDAIVAACTRSGAQALHPGYGFLSENPALARACEHAGIAFVGPPAPAGELMGDKLRAKQAASAAGVPVVPSYSEDGALHASADAFPLLVKAAAGGGGRGMRVVHAPDELEGALASARREALAGFGDDRVFIERFLPRARHLEVQVIADQHGNVVHLGERECSLQRRHQKVIEEAPSPVVDDELRAELGAQATALARASGYVNAGTVEFIADFDNPADHYFLEMNARLQVEHPVTELAYGVDLVELQLRVAAGEPLPLTQDDVRLRGHAIEARITAEDPARGFLPTAGRVLAYDRPDAATARVDDGIDVGSVVDTAYDSLLAKVIVHGADRHAALGRLRRALAQTTILGVTTTTGYLRGLIDDPAVVAGELDTGLIERGAVPAAPVGDAGIAHAAAMLLVADSARDDDPFARADGWRLSGERAASHWRTSVGGGEPVEVDVPAADVALVHRIGPDRFEIDGRGEWLLARDGDIAWLGHNGYAWPVRQLSAATGADALADGELRAPMPGQVLLVPASVGDAVSVGDPVVVLESMKMELVLAAPIDGAVAELTVAPGDKVAVDQPLARVEAAAP
ncbi:MAG TPA: biotin carboxylase N-terminal domain-containing protein [Solirubrobacteraceae bacterium]|nr:biotin carboxylase N-terminal domain-containing protein [Solirubrobacteraceae bacterium]